MTQGPTWTARGVSKSVDGGDSRSYYMASILSPFYTRKKKGSFLQKYKEPHTPKSIKDP